MQSGKYRSPGNRQTQTCPSDGQTVQWRRALHHGIRRFALHLVHLVAEWLLFPVASTLL
ncbi:unnamed protein product [Staurois parvus]|uniref:Uncharacterized protein n=1 Tax=Staurois parvus TaxID=386267 RepID=A0ABN9AEI2_9NEOB|nr:unnamed protein product [Staurois parvus]